MGAVGVASCGDENPQDPGDGGGNGGNGGSTVDTIPPAVVTNILVRSPTSSNLTLQWEAPGDDDNVGQAAEYDIRWSLADITEQNWESATRVDGVPPPKPEGDAEQLTVRQLPSSSDIYFAMKTYDEVPNESDLSECVVGTTDPEYVVPARVTDLTAIGISETEYRLTWTATGDDGVYGTATAYDVRYSGFPMNDQDFVSATQATGEPFPSPSGESDTLVVSIPGAVGTYYFALTVADEVGNVSEVSNIARGFAYDESLIAYPLDVYLGQTMELDIFFKLNNPANAAITITATRDSWPYEMMVIKHLLRDDFPAGVYHRTWDMSFDEGLEYDPPWPVQGNVRIHIGPSPVDSVGIRIHPVE
jgi:hypothetical protein